MTRLLTFIGVVLLALFLLAPVFVVYEGQRAIVVQFGKVLRDSDSGDTTVYEPGLHFKIPLIQKVRALDARIQTLEGSEKRFITAEKKDVLVTFYAKWRINDFAKFYLTTGGNVMTAESLLARKINNGLRIEFGVRTIPEIVSGSRDDLMREARIEASESASDLGVEIVDVRVKTINLPDEIRTAIFNRMRAERAVVAREHRSKGREEAEVLRAEIDRKVTVMLAEAERQSLTLRGEGEATAAKIYADAFGKNPEFYGFVRSLDAYKQSFVDKQDVMVIQPEGEFFKYMKTPEK